MIPSNENRPLPTGGGTGPGASANSHSHFTTAPANVNAAQRILSAFACGKRGCECAASVRKGEGLTHCPAHGDGDPSLHVSVKDGKLLVRDFGFCPQEAVIAALRQRGLWPDPSRNGRQIVATYDYVDETGALLFQVVRFAPKGFQQRRPDGAGGWTWSLDGVRRVLYRLPDVLEGVKAGATVYIVEGEKDADNLHALGLTATTNPGGAGKWRPEYGEALRGAHVVILPDGDGSGHRHAEQVARFLHGVAAEVRIVDLPGLPDKGDVSDWLAAGGTVDELLRLASAAPPWQPPKPAPAGGLVLTPLRDLLSEPEEAIPWLVDQMLPAGGLSLLAGKPKAGKSTLARNLALAVARGEPFLGRATSAGAVVYLALEEKRAEVQAHFARMGASEEPVFVHVGGAPEAALAALRMAIERQGAKLAIVDPLLRFVRLRDANDYAEVTAALEPLLLLARDTGCHILACHHLGKLEREGGDGILGSTALFGAVDTALLLRRREDGRVVSSIQRYGTDLPATILTFDVDTGVVAAGLAVAEAEMALAETKVLEAIADAPLAEADIRAAAGGNTAVTGRALRRLLAAGRVERTGTGHRGDPYLYGLPSDSRFSFSPRVETRNEKNEKTQKESDDHLNPGVAETLATRSGLVQGALSLGLRPVGASAALPVPEVVDDAPVRAGDCPSCGYTYFVNGRCRDCGAPAPGQDDDDTPPDADDELAPFPEAACSARSCGRWLTHFSPTGQPFCDRQGPRAAEACAYCGAPATRHEGDGTPSCAACWAAAAAKETAP